MDWKDIRDFSKEHFEKNIVRRILTVMAIVGISTTTTVMSGCGRQEKKLNEPVAVSKKFEEILKSPDNFENDADREWNKYANIAFDANNKQDNGNKLGVYINKKPSKEFEMGGKTKGKYPSEALIEFYTEKGAVMHIKRVGEKVDINYFTNNDLNHAGQELFEKVEKVLSNDTGYSYSDLEADPSLTEKEITENGLKIRYYKLQNGNNKKITLKKFTEKQIQIINERSPMRDLLDLSSMVVFVAIGTAIIGSLIYMKKNEGEIGISRDELRKKMKELEAQRRVALSKPLTEKTRPSSIKDIVGQEEGIDALRVALCGPNPQHVIIYGPPGVGKTAAARVILEEAKRSKGTPFSIDAPFVEIDATTLPCDERNIANPLLGYVHDPIWQGAGGLGKNGIPEPKPGAVTEAHGGVLFLDEIGELQSFQINKLLKVLEDRCVRVESAYYNSKNKRIPDYIHDIFKNGFPADFRLIGATTRSPEDIPEAIRSRCTEIRFRGLFPDEVEKIANNAVKKLGLNIEKGVAETVAQYCTNGRDTVKLIENASKRVKIAGRNAITKEDIKKSIEANNLTPRFEKKIPERDRIGCVNGLAVFGDKSGSILDVVAVALKNEEKKGNIKITGVVSQEEIDRRGSKIVRTSMARESLDNVLTAMKHTVERDVENYDIHVSFPGGIPVDGPSAGIAIATSIYSAINNVPVKRDIAMTGEVCINGEVKEVGGVHAKVEAARVAGAKKVLIPKGNWQDSFANYPIKVIPVETLEQVIDIVFFQQDNEIKQTKPEKEDDLKNKSYDELIRLVKKDRLYQK